jgi:hypothetical protein
MHCPISSASGAYHLNVSQNICLRYICMRIGESAEEWFLLAVCDALEIPEC